MKNYSFYIILVNNESPENVGFISRIMGNFNFNNLILINPSWDNFKKAEWFAYTKFGINILKNNKKFLTLENAINKLNLNLTIGFTRRAGKYREISSNYKDYFNNFFSKVIFNKLKIGLIFGRESSGLLDKEIRLCNNLLYIPTYSKSPSLNLSHAVSIILNELYFYFSDKKSIQSNLILDIEKMFKPSAIMERDNFYKIIFNEIKSKKLSINDDIQTFKRMFERIFSSPVISKKDLELFKRLLLRFLYIKNK